MSYFKACFAALLVLLASGSLPAQHPSWHNYTTSDGLPSNETFGLMQDKRGFLWFVTAQGVARFDGYTFQRPVDTSITANSSAFKISEDAFGRIWFNHLDATFSIVERDTVTPWKYNYLLSRYASKFRSFGSFAHEPDGTLWFPLLGLGILIAHPDGSHQIIPDTENKVLLFAEVAGKTIYSFNFSNDITEPLALDRQHLSPEFLFWKDGRKISLGRAPVIPQALKSGKPFEVKRLANGDYLVGFFQNFYIFRNNRLWWHGQKDLQLNHIYVDSDGSILLACAGIAHKGLLRFSSVEAFQRDSFVNLLPEHQVSSVIRDREGGWWATTLDAGVFYCKNPELEILDASTGLPSDQVIRLVTDGAKTVYAGFQTAEVCTINPVTGLITAAPKLSSTGNVEISDLYFDSAHKRLWSGLLLSYLENKSWKLALHSSEGKIIDSPIPVKKISASPSGKVIWASSPFGFFSIDPVSGKAFKVPEDPILAKMRTFSVTEELNGNLWVTVPDGLKLWQNGRYELPPFKHPALRFPARNVASLPAAAGGGIVISLRGGGLLIRDQNGGFTWLTTRNGLTSDVILNVEVTTEGVIYAATNLGLNIITWQADGAWHIETFTQKHGLPSNQVNDVAWLGQELWVATDKGIARIRKMPTPHSMPMPILEKFVVNNQPLAFSNHLELSHAQNNLSLRFFSLHLRSGGDILYRYRLFGTDTLFVYTRTREVNLANLSAGRYTFEVQAQNEDGQWGPSSRWAFQILPPWWATWWFRTLVTATLVVGLYLFYNNRLQNIQKEAADREKIRALEAAALRAQMNPHFVFNCLQAIQSFILKNNREEAITYLARFAKLVRLALHGAVDGKHSLSSEIAMLDHYLHLEQLRFRGKFDFVIQAEGLDLEDIQVPPMLVQPFVENAIKHGLQPLERDGKLEITFSMYGEKALEVRVKDNGPGFTEKQNGVTEKGVHRSAGISLTQKRLDMLSVGDGKGGAENLVRETLLDAEGRAVGACVRFFIPV